MPNQKRPEESVLAVVVFAAKIPIDRTRKGCLMRGRRSVRVE
jgi:hypothetical protein